MQHTSKQPTSKQQTSEQQSYKPQNSNQRTYTTSNKLKRHNATDTRNPVTDDFIGFDSYLTPFDMELSSA